MKTAIEIVALLVALCVMAEVLTAALRVALSERVKSRDASSRSMARMPRVDAAGLRNVQARGMGYNPRGHR